MTDYQTPAQQMIGDFAPKLVELTDEVLFGDVWARPQLSARDRSLVTCAALVTNGSIEQLGGHLGRARQNRLTETELKEMIIHLAFYAGWPRATSAISAVVIASQSGHRLGALTAEQDAALATAPADELLSPPMLQPDQVTDSLHAYQLAKRGNSLWVMAEAVHGGNRGARVNTISPGIIITPLARDELTGPRGEGYRRMLELSPAGRAGTPDEVGTVGALLMGPDGAFITGSDFLMDGGVTACYFFGELAPR
jgi:alkylhydroperoxidase/carboxymuconolactone decarboxylase family protein YurZ